MSTALRIYKSFKSIHLTRTSGFGNEECFKGIYGLTQIVLPETVTSICANAFKECYNLSTINLPGSLTEVGNNLFMATSLSEITFDGTLAQWEAITKEKSGRTVTIHCTDGDVEF